MSGFFLITRGISKHALFKRKPDRLAVWVWLLDNVAFKDTTQDAKGKTVHVPRGSVCASLRHIADETGVGHQVVRTALKRFQTEHMINTTVTHGKTVISLCNYEKHQRSEGAANTAPNTSLTQDQHKPNTQKKQGNKLNKEVDKSTSIQEAADYQEFLGAHPKPVDSKAGQAAFSKLVSDGVDPNQIIASAKSYTETVKGWSAESKVQQSDNFLDAERGKWKAHIPKPKAVAASEDDILRFWSEAVKQGNYITSSSISATRARAMVEAGYVTAEQLNERGIAI